MFPPTLQTIKNILLDLFFPPICLNCGKYLDLREKTNPQTFEALAREFLCAQCSASIKLNNTFFCPVCRARIPAGEKICHFDSVYLLAAASNYDDPVIQNLIHSFKYRKFETLSFILGEILIQYIEELIRNSALEIRNFSVIPIPLHSKRERERGFNQAELLSKKIASRFNLPLLKNLRRVKETDPQVGKKGEDRLKNIEGCFAIREPEEIRSKNIILIDDVFTSGATINEAVRILKEAGAKKIIALVVAKA